MPDQQTTQVKTLDLSLLERLRKVAQWDAERQFAGPSYHALLTEAADEVERLRGEVDRLDDLRRGVLADIRSIGRSLSEQDTDR